MTKINRKIGFIEFKAKWPNCIICRLQFLRSQRYFDEGTKVFKLNRFVLARLQRIEIQVLQLKLTSIKSVTNLKLCQDKSHRAMAKFVRAEFKEHLNKIQRNERTKTK